VVFKFLGGSNDFTMQKLYFICFTFVLADLFLKYDSGTVKDLFLCRTFLSPEDLAGLEQACPGPEKLALGLLDTCFSR
jgi:hypothetical protein